MTRTEVVLDIETFAHIPAPMMKVLCAREEESITLQVSSAAKPRPETVSKYHREYEAKMEAVPETVLEKAALSPCTGRIVSVGIGVFDSARDMEIEVQIAKTAEDEAKLLGEIDFYLRNRTGDDIPPTLLVTWNGRRFDLPFISVRSAILGFVPEWPMPFQGFRRDLHIDVMDFFGGVKPGGSLDMAAMAFGGVPKLSQGSEIHGIVMAENWDALEQHNRDDVEKTAKIWDRLRGVVRW